MVKNLQINVSVKCPIGKVGVHKAINILKKHHQVSIASLIINFVSPEQIKEINAEYLNHHYVTDIITFNYSGSNTDLDGEIFISPDEAAKNAKSYKIDFDNELKRLVVHGFLHLLGFDDKTRREKLIMRNMENQLLYRLNFTLLQANR
ncbi:MAG: rRNA maturation RNase YbeY [Ignavibacteriaceae bacterium]|nr:rRNA maturation RNase YbeY [Ignavibacteriaceae bacterium]